MRKWVTAAFGSRQRGTVDRDRVRIEAGRNPADAVAHASHGATSSTCARLPVRGPRIASKAGPKTQLGVAAKGRHVDEQLRAVEPNGNRVASQVHLGAGGGVARRRKPDGQYVHLGSRRDEHADDERASAKGRIRGKHSCPLARIRPCIDSSPAPTASDTPTVKVIPSGIHDYLYERRRLKACERTSAAPLPSKTLFLERTPMKHVPLNTNTAEKKKYLACYPLATKVGGRPSVKKDVPSDRPKQSDSAPSPRCLATSSDTVDKTPVSDVEPCTTANRKRGGGAIPKGITALVHPAILKEQYAVEVLRCLARFRIVRAVDIATYCFAERPYTVARQAARGALANLVKERCALRYVTQGRQTIYAMTERGKRLLESYGFEGTSSIRRAANMVNPRHTLWLNFIALACEARGLQAFTESEILRAINDGVLKVKDMKRRGVLLITAEYKNADGTVDTTRGLKKTALLPDVIALEEDGITWFEIDASRRGPDRMARLMGLIKKVGSPVPILANAYSLSDEQSLLRRISFQVTDPYHFARIRNKLVREVRDTERNILTESANNLRLVLVPSAIDEALSIGDVADPANGLASYSFEVWRARDSDWGQEDVCVGHVLLQLLPIGLPNYKGDDKEKSNPMGWFEQNYLPYMRPTSMGKWRKPVSQFPLKLKRLGT